MDASTARRLMVTAWVVGLLGLALVAGSLVWLRTGYVLSRVNSESMTPTYGVGDRIVAERVDGDEVEPGDVVLFLGAGAVRVRRALHAARHRCRW